MFDAAFFIDMKKIILYTIIFICFFLVCCLNDRKSSLNTESVSNNEILAYIDDFQITRQEVDSIAIEKIYNIRLKILENQVDKYILQIAAKKNKMSYEDYFYNEILQKSSIPTKSEIINYNEKESVSNDTLVAHNYLSYMYRNKRKKCLIDSLKQQHNINIKLQIPLKKVEEHTNFYFHRLNKTKSNTELIVILSFKCPACQKAQKKIVELQNKYNNQVSFKFIYFSEYAGMDVMACEAAARQNRFKPMYDMLFLNSKIIDDSDSIYYNFAKEIGLNINQFKNDMQDEMLLKEVLYNKKQLLENKIYSTPAFIINERIIEDKYALDYIEDIIIEEIEKSKEQ